MWIQQYLISIKKDYQEYSIFKNDLYYVNFRLLKKCNSDAWKKILCNNEKNKNYDKEFGDVININEVILDDEVKFITDNNIESD